MSNKTLLPRLLNSAALDLCRAAASNQEFPDKTPARFVKAWEEIFEFRDLSLEEIADRITTFPASDKQFDINEKLTIDQMVLVRDISFHTMCEHHMLPFFGKVHIAYIPKECIAGLSKFARTVKMLSGRLQIQERLTCNLADIFEYKLEPLGVAVVIEARHMCMEMRGIQHIGAITTTSTLRGAFKESASLRSELFSTINSDKRI